MGESNVLKTKGGAVPSTDYILLIYILWSFVIILLEIFRYLGYAYAQYLPRPIDTRIFRTRGIFFEAYGYLQKQRVIFRSRGTFFEAEGYISSKSNAEGYLPNQRDIIHSRVSDKTKVFKQSYFLTEAFLPKHDRGIFYLPDG